MQPQATERGGGRPVCMSTLVTTACRVIFNCLCPLEELFHSAFLKGKEGLGTTTVPHCIRTKRLSAHPASAKAAYGQAS